MTSKVIGILKDAMVQKSSARPNLPLLVHPSLLFLLRGCLLESEDRQPETLGEVEQAPCHALNLTALLPRRTEQRRLWCASVCSRSRRACPRLRRPLTLRISFGPAYRRNRGSDRGTGRGAFLRAVVVSR